MKPRIHYHTDCPWFAGCENMLVNLLSMQDVRSRFHVSLSYRDTEAYTSGLNRRVKIDFPTYPLRFPDPSNLIPFVHRWPTPFNRLARVASRQIATLPAFLHEVCVLQRLLARLRPDVLHINNGGYPAALSARAAAIAGRLAGVPHVLMVVNNLAVGHRHPSRWFGYFIDRLVVSSVSKFLTGSQAARVQLRRALRLDEGDCLAFPNGIALRKPTETKDQTRTRLGLDGFDGVIFGVIAVLEPRKGHQVLLEACAKLVRNISRNSQPRFKVLLEGVGPLRKALQAFAQANQLSEHCVFIGQEKNVMNVLSLIDVLILPSVSHEDFPNVTLEAMGVGKPVIASRVAGTPEQVLDGITGVLVTPRNADELAEAMARFCGDEDLRHKMGKAARSRFESDFTATIAVKRYAELYYALVSTHQAS